MNSPHPQDITDPLAAYRDRFVIDDPDLIYLNGNSLGRMPKAVAGKLNRTVAEGWGQELVRGWTSHGWFKTPGKLGDRLAPIIGAGPGQVVVCDTTSINLYKLAMAALELRPGRRKIISNTLNFPSDLYVLQGCVKQLADRHELVLIDSEDGIACDPDQLLAAIDGDTALVSLSHVEFKSGYLNDLAAITARAQAVGALVLWDVCHSVGVVPLELDATGVDFAVGCSYKYLNGGPGSPAFLYVNRQHHDTAFAPLTGWFGQHKPFDFGLDYEPAPGISHFLVSSPPIISMVGTEAGLEVTLEAGIETIRAKSLALSNYMIEEHDRLLASHGYELLTPRDPDRRGAQISLRHTEGYRISQALRDRNVIVDFREPDVIRMGLAPLYTRFGEIEAAVGMLAKIVDQRLYDNYSPGRSPIT